MSKYLVVHKHDFGSSVYIVESDTEPTEKQLVRCIDLDYEPSKGEYLDVTFVEEIETFTLDWQDGDDEEFVEDDEEEDENDE